MKQIYKILLITLTLCFTLTKAENSENLKFLSESLSKIGESYDSILHNAEGIISNLNDSFNSSLIPEECKEELISMKSVIEAITKATETDEMIFNAAKDIVNHFPGLKEKCKIPLPTIDTSKWDYEKFKKYHCVTEVVAFAGSASACYGGAYIACAKALQSLVSIAKCIKDII
jgi:hypothetical protein